MFVQKSATLKNKNDQIYCFGFNVRVLDTKFEKLTKNLSNFHCEFQPQLRIAAEPGNCSCYASGIPRDDYDHGDTDSETVMVSSVCKVLTGIKVR